MSVAVPSVDEFAAQVKRIDDLDRRLKLVEGGAPPADPPPVPEDPPQQSGFWLSGGNPNNNTQAGAEQFGRWRGKKVDTALTYPTRDAGWGPLISATSGQPGAWTDKSVVLLIQMPFFPQGAYTYAAAARGEYDAQWKQLGTNWAAREAAGFARPVFSPGWEANHNGAGMHYWGGPGGGPQRYPDYAAYIAVYQRFVTKVRETYPAARFGWMMNGHDSPGFGAGAFPANDPRNIYPGKGYVDVIGVDYYDHFPPSFGGTSTSSRRKDFDVESREVNGVRWYLDFARSEGKAFGVFEWACNSGNVGGGDHGGDNPTFITNMVKVFREALAAKVGVYECYYEDTAQRMGIMNGQNPNAAAAYLSLYRA